MTPRFGTDGIRGVAGIELTAEIVARARARPRCARSAPTSRSSIARDTRRSGPDARGRAGRGHHARRRRRAHASACCPTPGLAGACVGAGARRGDDLGEPQPVSRDNGIKLFERGGRKLRDETEAAVEAELARDPRRRRADRRRRRRGSGRGGRPTRVDDYVARLVAAAGGGTPFAGLRVVLDCAHGAASDAAPAAFARARRRRSTVIGAEPDGTQHQRRVSARPHPSARRERGASRAAPTPGSRSTATRTASSRSTSTAAVVDGDHILAIARARPRRARRAAAPTRSRRR